MTPPEITVLYNKILETKTTTQSLQVNELKRLFFFGPVYLALGLSLSLGTFVCKAKGRKEEGKLVLLLSNGCYYRMNEL